MEEKVSSGAEDVKAANTEETTETTTEEKETESSDVERNKTLAIQQERERRKEAEAKLREYEKKEADAIEKDKIKKWRYEEVLNEQKAKIEAYEKERDELMSYRDNYSKLLDSQVEAEFAKIPEAKKDFAKKLIEWKSHNDKLEIVKEFASTFWNYDANPKWSKIANTDLSWFEQAKSNNDIRWMIANAPVISTK